MDFRRGRRYRNPQAWIDYVVRNEAALQNVALSHHPRYSARLRAFGMAVLDEESRLGKTLIGKSSLASRLELIDTIIHEELHHRIWKRALRGRQKDIIRTRDLDLEESYVELVTARFMRTKGF
jgi:predicted SprT family Zn-dependent metalloprotease